MTHASKPSFSSAIVVVDNCVARLDDLLAALLDVAAEKHDRLYETEYTLLDVAGRDDRLYETDYTLLDVAVEI